MTRRLRGDHGAVTALELVLVSPLFLALVVFVVFCGRMGRTAQVVRSLAASAARAASIERSPGEAERAAAQAVGTLDSGDLTCRGPRVSFGSDGAVDTVTVRVTCVVSLSGLALLPLSGTRTFSYAATEPIDRYRGE